ncbi:helix-turn-helix domain-containing protein [Plantactinospora sp. CA-294935]|uniref:helix-turn-helix domain-containing protein n=1 Tax=Plantactinospora sp. CA-294935 TaxID=3240012 RepID=UPI003D8B39DA
MARSWLAEVARLGGLSASHLSRIEAGERPVTPATVELYQRAVRLALSEASSPTVDEVRRKDLFALAGATVAGAVAGASSVVDLDECAQWIAWEIWRGDGHELHQSLIPAALRPATAQLVQRRQLVRTPAGAVRFAHPGLLDFHLACRVFGEITAGASGRLETTQTSHATDLVIREFVQQDAASEATLSRWMRGGATDVLRVNAAGILAKVEVPETADRVIAALRADEAMRALYLTAVASRVLGLPWVLATQFAQGSAVAGPDAALKLAEELRNPRDAAARWCSRASAAGREPVRAAVADALRTESASENLRTMAALLAGADPITTTAERPR